MMNGKRTALVFLTLALCATGWLLLESRGTGTSLTLEALTADPVLEAIDEARFQRVTLLDGLVDFPRPADEAARQLATLHNAAPGEERYASALAEVFIALGREGDALETMRTMAEAHEDRTTGLVLLADYHHSRLSIEREIAVLERVADLQQGADRVKTLERVLALAENHLVMDVDRVAMLRRMIEAQPDAFHLRSQLIKALQNEERFDEAISAADTAMERFPDQRTALLTAKADVLQAAGRTDAALALFDVSYNPVDDLGLFNAWMDQLRSANRYTRYQRELKRTARLGQLSGNEFARHILLMRSENRMEEAERTVDAWMKAAGAADAAQLTLFSRTYETTGRAVKAWQTAYAAYIVADSSDREDALFRLARLTKKYNAETLPVSQGFSPLFNTARFDTGPGLLSGLLSLLYNDQDIAGKVEDHTRMQSRLLAAGAWFSLFETFRETWPDSEHTAALYADAVDLYSTWNRHMEAIRTAEVFLNTYPEDENYWTVAEAAIRSLQSRDDAARVSSLYLELIRRADMRDDDERYYQYLSSLVRHYTENKNLNAAIQLYWNEINAHPGEEQLYDRFLTFIGRHRIFDEEMKVYKRAIEQFGTNDYYDKLARWYLRNKRTTEFQDLTRRVADIFSGSELAEYFDDHLQTSRSASDADSVFYRTMYEYANRQFPRNMRFVRGLLNYYSRYKMWDDFDTLSRRYFYADATIRKNWLWRLSAQKRLFTLADELWDAALPDTLDTGTSAALPESPADMLFVAEAAQWGNYHEAALPAWQHLAEGWPTQTEYREALARLQRSLGRDEAARQTYGALAQQFPARDAYPTAAGEIAITAGDLQGAETMWRRIISVQPAEAERYKQVAAIFWDYYQFDRAATVLLEGRSRLNNPALFGYTLGAVYESASRREKAIDEYVAAVTLNWDSYYERETPLDRLVTLNSRHSLGQRIRDSFLAYIEATDNTFVAVQAYDDYLTRIDADAASRQLLKESIARAESVEFAYWLIGRLNSHGMAEAELQAIQRLIDIAGENTENLMTLALFHERQGELERAETILLKRVDMTKTDEPEAVAEYLSALDDAARFAWRHDRFDEAFSRWQQAVDVAPDNRRRSLSLQLAEKLILKERYQEAVTLLRARLKEDPTSTELFNAIAGVYTAREDYRGLADLYSEGIEAVRTADTFSADGRRYRISLLRQGLIDNLVELGDTMAAVDQYIELINRNYDDNAYLQNAWYMAEEHDHTERLIGYYQRTSEESSKDFRWNVVLGRLYRLQGDLQAAEEQWRKAVANEPQRINLRRELADVLLADQQYEAAVEQYEEIYRLDRRNTSWLSTIARAQALAGDMDAAKKTLTRLEETAPNAADSYFETAGYLVRWGEFQEAFKRLDKAMDAVQKNIYENRLYTSNLETYIQTGLRIGKAEEVFSRLLELNRIYGSEADRSGNRQSYVARNGQSMTFNAFSGSFAEAMQRWGSDADYGAIGANLERFMTGGGQSNENTVNWVLQTARALGLNELTGRAFTARFALNLNEFRSYDSDGMFGEMLEYYQQRGMVQQAAEHLERELARMDMRGFRTTVLAWLADLYRHGSDTAGELRTLRRYYEDQSGSTIDFGSYDVYMDRYLDLLLADNNMTEARRLAESPGRFAGQVINRFFAEGEAELVDTAINAAARRFNPAWRDSKKMLVALHSGISVDSFAVYGPPEGLMQDRPISRRAGVELDTGRVFAGDNWYDFVPHYADQLLEDGNRDKAVSFARGITENSPRSAEAQRQTARWMARHKLWEEVRRHLELAEQLAPEDPDNFLLEGSIALWQNDMAGAAAAWRQIIEGTSNPSRYEMWFETMVEADMLDEALPDMHAWIISELDVEGSWWITNLVSRWAEVMEEGGRSDEIADVLLQAVEGKQDPLQHLAYIYEQIAMPTRESAVLLDRIVATARQGIGSSNEEQRDSLYRNWLEIAIEFADENDMHERALAWIADYRTAGFDEEPSWRIRSKAELMRMLGKAYLHLDRIEEGLTTLRNAIDPEDSTLSDYRAVADILRDAGADRQARNLLIGFFEKQLLLPGRSADWYAELADLLLERDEDGDKEQAVAVLNKLVSRSSLSEYDLRQAAGVAEKHQLSERELTWRRQLWAIASSEFETLLRIAELEAETGNREDALTAYRSLFSSMGVEHSVLMDAMEGYVAMFSGEAALREQSRYSERTRGSEIITLLAARLLVAGGGREKGAEPTGAETLHQPARLLAWQASRADDPREKAALYGQSLADGPSADVRKSLAEALNAAGQHEKALLLFDNWSWRGLNAPDANEVGTLTGLSGKALLDTMHMLVDAGVKAGRFETALQLENSRLNLADRLGVTTSSAVEDIHRQLKAAAPPDPPIMIQESIANPLQEEIQ